MKLPAWLTNNFSLKFLSLVLAVFIWFLVAGGEDVERAFTVPVTARNLSAGLAPRNPLPQVEIRVAGPRYVMAAINKENLSLTLDFSGTSEGRVAFNTLERGISLPLGSRLTRLFPASVEVQVVKMRNDRRSE